MKKIIGVYRNQNMHWVGDGFPVKNLFSYDRLGQAISPFLLLDYAAPYPFAPTAQQHGVGPHPHRGFETVTIAYQGAVTHKDSAGGGGTIQAGDVQWMTAGAGLVHEEFHSAEFAQSGGLFEMAQLWVNLPAKDKMAAPKYQAIAAQDIPAVQFENDAGQMRIRIDSGACRPHGSRDRAGRRNAAERRAAGAGQLNRDVRQRRRSGHSAAGGARRQISGADRQSAG